MIDLHCHTTCSDGSDPPAALVRLAAEAGIRHLSITDHDTTAAYDQAEPAAGALGLELLVGVELSLDFAGGTFHLLGYLIDRSCPALVGALARVQEWRATRNVRMVERLAAMGLPIDQAGVEGVAAGGQIGRPHLARVLVDRGAAATVAEAFERYLGRDSPAYVPRPRLSPAEGIALVHAAGGVAVLAHPYQLRLGDAALRENLRTWSELGLDGVEVYYSRHTPMMVEQYLGLAREFDLVVTGGSDYHGLAKPDIALGDLPAGVPPATELLAGLQRAAEKWR